MKTKEVKEAIEKIKIAAIKGDDVKAHRLEDSLYYKVISHYAYEGTGYLVARTALETLDIDFQR